MAGTVRVDDVEALKRLRAQVAKFAEALSTAVSEASADVNHTLHWLEIEQSHKWKLELRKRHDRLQQALDAVRQKQLYKGPAGERQSYVDEQHRANQCRAALEEAQAKLHAIASHKNKLSREAVLFQGALARISTIAHQSAPAALAELANMILAVEKYAAITVDEVGSTAEVIFATSAAPAPGMARISSSPPAPEGLTIDWDQFARRAADGLSRLGGEVVSEPHDPAGPFALLRDGFSARIFLAPLSATSLTDRPELSHATLAELTAALPSVSELLIQPGERRALFQGGDLLWHN